MAGELIEKSSSRGGATVLWLALHTAEGPYDDDPADPKVDPKSARQLLAYFRRPEVRASSHAIADDDELLDNLVPYDRASWTLRGGNARSDNLELCGRAGWSRAEWLRHRPMLTLAARWLASRCKARGLGVPRYVGEEAVRRRVPGIIDHNDYTRATGDGTHWDCGPNFPWDIVIPLAQEFYGGRPAAPTRKGLFVYLTEEQELEVLAAARQVNATAAPGTRGAEGTWEATLAAARSTFNELGKLAAEVRANAAIVGDDEGKLTAAVAASELRLRELIESLRPEPELPPVIPGPTA